jgi:stage V sporulation protein B
VNEAVTRGADAAVKNEPDGARRAGRGILSISASKLYFLIIGYAAQLLLPRLLGSPEAFGFMSVALSFVSILNNVLVVATIQVVSKRVSEDKARADHTLRQALELQLVVGGLVGSVLFLAAPLLAGKVLLDPLLTPLFRLAAVIVVSYALYSAPIGALNGRQNFRAQARFDMGYTTLRTVAMLSAAALGFGAFGVFAGFALSSVLVLVAACVVVGTGKAGGRVPWGGWLAWMAPLFLYQLCINLILQVDVTLLKRTVAELLQARGQTAVLAAETASRYVGFYRAAQTFAFVPYQLILSVAFVIFPMVSEALGLGDEAAARRYIRGALRFSLLVLLAVAAPFAGAAPAVMRLVYPAAYVAGAPALSVLVLAMVCFALFVIAATIISGAGRPGLAAGVALASVGCVFVGNLGLVRYAGVGEHTLLAAASGTAIGIVLALLAMGGAVYARFGAFIAPATVVRALLAAAAAFAIAGAIHTDSKLLSLGALALGALGYGLVLVLLRELTRADLDAGLAVVLRRKR